MNRAQANRALRLRNYTPAMAAAAVTEAARTGGCDLARHRVILVADGDYQITPRPWVSEELNVMDGLSTPASARYPSLDAILETIELVDGWLDEQVAGEYKAQPLGQDWARTAKIGEEIGEAREELALWWRAADESRLSDLNVPAGRAIAALIAITGQNPRKGVHGSREDLLGELGDVAATALFAIQHFTKDTDVTWEVILLALAKARGRVPADPDQDVGDSLDGRMP